MNKIRGNSRRIVTWLIGAALTFGPAAFVSSALRAQAQDQSNQQGAPPPDAQNGQQPDDQAAPPPPPPYAGNGQQQDNGQTPPPPPAGNSQDQQDQGGGPGQWGPAGPPPDAQNGQIPPSPQDEEQGPSQQNPDQGQPEEQGAPYNSRPILPNAPVVLPAGTILQIRTSQRLDTKKLHVGDYFRGTLARSVFRGNMLVVPRGADITGQVVDLRKAGDLKGSARLALQIASLHLSGQSYALNTDVFSVKSPGKGGYTASNAIGGAFLGSVIGAIAGGGAGAAIGAAAGTGVGLGASAASPGPRNVIPAESVLTFHLTSPVTVNPVTYQEVQELEENAPPPPQPRYPPRYGYPPPPPPYYGGYPPPPPPPPPGYPY